jgi:autotransporter translocation and assembly factor TamB
MNIRIGDELEAYDMQRDCTNTVRISEDVRKDVTSAVRYRTSLLFAGQEDERSPHSVTLSVDVAIVEVHRAPI